MEYYELLKFYGSARLRSDPSSSARRRVKRNKGSLFFRKTDTSRRIWSEMNKLILILLMTAGTSFAEFSGAFDKPAGDSHEIVAQVEASPTPAATQSPKPSLADAGKGAGVFILFCTFAFVAYFLPALVAYFRHHHNQNAICVLNLLLGWTALGWVVALIWAATSPVPAKK